MGFDADTGLLEQFAYGSIGQRLPALDGASDREPVRRAGSGRVMTEEQQYLAVAIHRKDTGRLALNRFGHHSFTSIRRIWN